MSVDCQDLVWNNPNNVTVSDIATWGQLSETSDNTKNCMANTPKSKMNKLTDTAEPVIHFMRDFTGDGSDQDVNLIIAQNVTVLAQIDYK